MTALQTELLQISVSGFNETSQEEESKSKVGQLLCSNYCNWYQNYISGCLHHHT